MSFCFEQTLGFNRCHAAGAGRGDGLAVNAVLHVARMENAVDIGARAAMRNHIALGIEIELAR